MIAKGSTAISKPAPIAATRSPHKSRAIPPDEPDRRQAEQQLNRERDQLDLVQSHPRQQKDG